MGQRPDSWLRDGGGDVPGFDSQPDAAMEPGLHQVSSWLVRHVSTQQVEMRRQAPSCPHSPLGLPGDPSLARLGRMAEDVSS